jgi:hypothetical protein
VRFVITKFIFVLFIFYKYKVEFFKMSYIGRVVYLYSQSVLSKNKVENVASSGVPRNFVRGEFNKFS